MPLAKAKWSNPGTNGAIPQLVWWGLMRFDTPRSDIMRIWMDLGHFQFRSLCLCAVLELTCVYLFGRQLQAMDPEAMSHHNSPAIQPHLQLRHWQGNLGNTWLLQEQRQIIYSVKLRCWDDPFVSLSLNYSLNYCEKLAQTRWQIKSLDNRWTL